MASHKKYATLLNKRGRDGLPTLPREVQGRPIRWAIMIEDGVEYYIAYTNEVFRGRDLIEARSALKYFEEGLNG